MGKYSRNTHGLNAQVYVSPSVAYSAKADLFAIVDDLANLTNGQIAIIKTYDATTGVQANGGLKETAVLSAGDKYKIVQVMDGELKFSNEITYGSGTQRLVAYNAPVKQLQAIQITSGALTNKDVFALSIRNTTPGNMPFPVEEVSFAAKTGSETAAQVAAGLVTSYASVNKIQFNYEQDYLISVNDAVALVSTTISVTKNSTAATVSSATGISAGQVLLIASVPYKVASITGLNVVLTSAYQGTTNATAALSKPSTSFVFVETKNFGEHFRSVFLQELEASLTGQLDYKLGSGSYEDIKRLEEEGQVFAGYEAGNIAFSEDWGKPSSFVTQGVTYDMVFIEYVKTQNSVAHPFAIDTTLGNIILVFPSSGTTPKASIQTVLGV